MNTETKQAYLDKTVAQLGEWNGRLDALKARASQFNEDVRTDYNQKIESWQEKQTAFSQSIAELRSSSVDGFENLKSGMQNAGNEIDSLIKTLEEKYK